jgi:hypothetical protein
MSKATSLCAMITVLLAQGLPAWETGNPDHFEIVLTPPPN